MILQFKIYLISILYLFGVLFMTLFPPRNFKQSGAKMRHVRSVGQNLKYPNYVDYKELVSLAQRLMHEDPEVTSVMQLGSTAKNRTIVALELHSDALSKKPGILIIAGLNGMAWGASNAVLEIAEKLLYDSNYQTPFFNDYDWYLIPMANPDGLHFTQKQWNLRPYNATLWSTNITARSSSRPDEWHKNLDDDGNGTCFGTNINRNFAYHWQDHERKKPTRCSQWYPGDKPFSTLEATAIREYVDRLGDAVQLAIHLHASFVPKKEFLLYPWRFSTRLPSNHLTLQAIGEYAARQSRLSDGRLYEVHQSSADGRVAGSLVDYLAGVVGTELVYLVKPYHQKYPNYTDYDPLKSYVSKATTAVLSLVRGWRRSTKQNTLSFFGTDVEF